MSPQTGMVLPRVALTRILLEESSGPTTNSVLASLPSPSVAWAGPGHPEPLFPLIALRAQSPVLNNGPHGSETLLLS